MLSKRGMKWAAAAYVHGERNDFHPVTNPNGTISFGWAEIRPMHKSLTEFFNKFKLEERYCGYGEGYTGSVRLRKAMATHMNRWFNPAKKIDAEQLTFAAGVTELNEMCALTMCDEGDTVLLAGPNYGSFNRDMMMRTGVQTHYVDTGDADQFSTACVPAFEAGYEAIEKSGVKVRAILICNPHNPLGRCYPRETLVELMRFCGSKGIHLISDEIYGLSVYARDDRPSETFTSVRAIDPIGLIDPAQVHVLYGMSKDFAAAGLRLGCLISQNEQLNASVRATCRFSSPSQVSMFYAERLLEDQEFVASFIRQSRLEIHNARLMAEECLKEHGIPYYNLGNAGLFIWLDLTSFLPVDETGGDGWAAEELLRKRFAGVGVSTSSGKIYNAFKPGAFRVIFTIEEYMVKEGIKRIAQVVRSR